MQNFQIKLCYFLNKFLFRFSLRFLPSKRSVYLYSLSCQKKGQYLFVIIYKKKFCTFFKYFLVFL